MSPSRHSLLPPLVVAALLGLPSPGLAQSLSIGDAPSVTEGNNGTKPMTFTVTLSPAAGSTVTVDYDTRDGTATAGSDYVAASGTLTFLAGETSKTINVSIVGDAIDEADENLWVDLSNPFKASIGDGSGVGTIVDDDISLITIGDAAVTEGNSGTVSAVFAVTLSTPNSRTVTVNWATANGTAVAPGDYTAVGSTVLTWNPGQTSKSVLVTVLGDTLDEDNETFTVKLSSPTNAMISDSTGLGTIIDDDASPVVDIANAASVPEGNAGTTSMIVTVTLTQPSGRTVTVNFASANGTAIAPADYTAVSGTLTFAAGEVSKPVTVSIQGDLLDESNEYLYVNLSTPVNVTLGDTQGYGYINDDDTSQISIADTSVTEGSGGTVVATFPVSLSVPNSSTLTVTYSTANGTAVATADYTAIVAATVTFAPGETLQDIVVIVLGDTLDEDDETFQVNLTGASRGSIIDNLGVGTIMDNDPMPSLGIANASSVTEGDAGTKSMTFTVTLTPASGRTVSVHYASVDGTAVAPDDYTAVSGTLTFAPGEVSKTATVAIVGDLVDEVDESLAVSLSAAVNAAITGSSGTGSVLDNDTSAISIDDVTVVEGNSGATLAGFLVTLSCPNSRTVTVDYATADVTATAPADYVAVATTTLSFSPGVVSKGVKISVVGETLDEDSETFQVNLTTPVNASILDATGIGTITDDDSASLSISDVAVTEGNSGTTPAIFTVSLSGPSIRTVTVVYATEDGTATAPADYTSIAGATLTFAPGEVSKSAPVQVVGDKIFEGNENYHVKLSAATNASISDGSGEGTITDDEAFPQLTLGYAPPIAEGNIGTATMTFNVDLSPASSASVTVDYSTSDGTATAPADYVAIPLTPLVFAAGQTSKSISVSVKGDLIDEVDESFGVALSNPVNATISVGARSGVITDDDTSEIRVDDVSLPEGNSGTAPAVFTATLSRLNSRAVTVDWATADGTAVAPGDYTAAATTTLTIAAGTWSNTMSVPIRGDTVDEPNETFVVILSNPVNAVLSDSTGRGSILDDDLVGGIADGSVPNAPLLVRRNPVDPTHVDLTWGASCGASATDYAIYEGTLGSWYDHAAVSCTSAGGWSYPNLEPSGGDRYFLAVPLSSLQEGSYGRDSGGTEIPASSAPCLSVQDLTACP